MKPTESAFIESCKQMNSVAVISQNWLSLSCPRSTQAVRFEQGCIKSVRLALLARGSGLVTAESALQIVVLPAAFDGVSEKGFERARWQLLVYSWLGRELTLRLLEHLKSKLDCSCVKCFLATPQECLPL